MAEGLKIDPDSAIFTKKYYPLTKVCCGDIIYMYDYLSEICFISFPIKKLTSEIKRGFFNED